MKKLKKLSLKKEIEREAEALEKEVSGRKDLDHITVSEDMEEALFQKIQDYEYEKRAKVVYRKKKKRYAIIAVAAVFILVFGSVMTGVGSKSYWKVWWNRDESGEKASYIDVENMDLQEIEDTNEVYIYKEISKQLGIHFNYHMLRHTLASRMAEKGADMKATQEILRHANISTTMNIYTHVNEKNKEKALYKAFPIQRVK